MWQFHNVGEDSFQQLRCDWAEMPSIAIASEAVRPLPESRDARRQLPKVLSIRRCSVATLCPWLDEERFMKYGPIARWPKKQHQRWLEFLCCQYSPKVDFQTGHY